MAGADDESIFSPGWRSRLWLGYSVIRVCKRHESGIDRTQGTENTVILVFSGGLVNRLFQSESILQG